MKITAVIPIRSGSQRVKDKNLRAFADTGSLKRTNTQGVPPPSTLNERQSSIESRLSSIFKSEKGVQ